MEKAGILKSLPLHLNCYRTKLKACFEIIKECDNEKGNCFRNIDDVDRLRHRANAEN